VDAIGDYVLFRNFIEKIKNNGKYKGYRIVLCGNIIWKNMAMTLDKSYIDEFIWVDKKKMVRSVKFRSEVLKQIHRVGASVAIQPTYSRDYYSGDSAIWASKAKEKVGSQADMTILTRRQKSVSDRYYTRLINISGDILFEFDRNKEIVSKIIAHPVELLRPQINVDGITVSWFIKKNDFIVICPSASSDSKKWSTTNFAELAGFIIKEYGLEIVIVGGKEDTVLAEKIMEPLDKSRVTDLTGKTSLVDLSKILSMAKLVISNDTAAAHIGAAVNTPVVCISRGDHFGRFTQYPEEKKRYFTTIYPEELRKVIDDKDLLRENFRYKSRLDINSVRAEDVKEVVAGILKAG
jgi:ADP-heptose:LPS heptosyltransferase